MISTVPLKQKKDNEIEITKHVSQLDLNKISSYIAEYEKKKKQNQKVMDTVRKTFREELIVTDVVVFTKRGSDSGSQQSFDPAGMSGRKTLPIRYLIWKKKDRQRLGARLLWYMSIKKASRKRDCDSENEVSDQMV